VLVTQRSTILELDAPGGRPVVRVALQGLIFELAALVERIKALIFALQNSGSWPSAIIAGWLRNYAGAISSLRSYINMYRALF